MSNLTSKHLTALLFLIGATSTAAADTFTVDGLQYETLGESTVKVKKYISGDAVVIPATVDHTTTRHDDVTDTDVDVTTTYDVVSVASMAFRSASPHSVTVAGSIKELEYYAFSRCKMVELILEEGVETIGYGAFSYCDQLQFVTLPSTLKVLGDYCDLVGYDGSAFANCYSLTSVDIPGSVEVVPQLTFQECAALSEVTLHEGTTTIDERAFEKCAKLKAIDLPSSVTTLERGAFMSTGLEHLTVPGRIKEIPNSAFLWCYNLQDFTIEEGVEVIGRQSFADCGSFTEVNVPNSVTHINTDAFQGNGGVTSIHLGNGVKAIGHSVLAVWAPDVETNTPHWALTDIYVTAPVPPDYDTDEEHLDELEPDFFFGEASFSTEKRQEFFSTVTLHVPSSAVEAYRAHAIWGNFVNIDGTAAIAIVADDLDPDTRVEIYNLQGMKVAEATASTLDTDLLDKGVYIVRSHVSTRKIIVR